MSKTHIITLSCEDRPGIVAGLTTELFEAGANIAESAQFWDRDTGRFFLRIAAEFQTKTARDSLERQLAPLVARFGMHLKIADAARRPKIIAMVSSFDHALLHLLYQIRTGWLNAEVVAIVSNHEASRPTAERNDIPFYHWPVTQETKAEQEDKLITLVRESDCDLVVLARYMQILSDNLSTRLSGKVINIHHSFLPSFKGAKPYHQAHKRGVKLIGATAHYVTADLDEGPIIEQETERVSHALSPDDLVATGRDIESRVLARAVKLHLEGRVMLNGARTVVFG
ncbi:formyltetrahydrofolate deformylase [Jiella sp. MQZ9-1]|uniref:Formyltetrahydrofolate deformylase n=1 Tax=Jiella flava TaxID=2816857 RepID=A0A939FY68_9HYPH|nr:formyltetrahydrofolate deformylase [Jiella flava]MBO0662381.1 formyltetrahydrofolate deformylase [Jiella flava]MCD2471605.1 formyltetrahydrofolate deformylase [Jiella flava]